MPSLLSSLLGEVRGATKKPTITSVTSRKRRAVVPATSDSTTSAPINRASTAAQQATIRKTASCKAGKPVTPLRRPRASPDRAGPFDRLPPCGFVAREVSLNDGESTSNSLAATSSAHALSARSPTPGDGGHRATQTTLSYSSLPKLPLQWTSVNPARSSGIKRVSDGRVRKPSHPHRPLTPTPPTQLIGKEGRLSEAAYNNMSLGDLRVKARRRGLQLDDDSKHYLITVLMVYDEEYDQLYKHIGNPLECVAYARAAVEHHNGQVRNELVKRRLVRTELENSKSIHMHTEKPRSAIKVVKSAMTVKKNVEKSVEVRAVATTKQQQAPETLARKSRPSTDSGYSTGSVMAATPPPKTTPSKMESLKGKKHTLPDDDEDTSRPLKKTKLSTMEQVAPRLVKKIQQRRVVGPKEESSRSTKAGKGTSGVASASGPDSRKSDAEPGPGKKVLKGKKKENRSPQEKEAPVRGIAKRVSPGTRSNKPAEPTKILGKRKARVEESESISGSESEDDWLVDDVQARSKKKVNRGVSKFFAGMR